MLGIDRLPPFLNPEEGLTLILDTSAGLSLGVLPGLENFKSAVQPLLQELDGLVCSPGQIGRLGTLKKTDAALLVRTDWNNTLRGADFVLPATQPQRVSLLSARDALDLGARAMVSTFLLGYEEELEAACLQTTVQLALDGKAIGLPLLVEVQTSGSRVSLPAKAIELGASYALEGGADAIVLPFPGQKSLETLGHFLNVPWLIKPSAPSEALAELQAALQQGAAGLWLDQAVFQRGDALEALHAYRQVQRTGVSKA
jgi:DhnA family fructose-bisphosphate aldolase class Ia